MQAEIVADWADGKRLAFIGDGDAISVCVAYLRARDVIDFGPTKITVFDFDERNVQAIRRFADHERIGHLDAELYNVLEPFPQPGRFDCFYTNPPWGASNQGDSVNVFMQRGFEAIGHIGDGLCVIADDDELVWSKVVLANVQQFASEARFYVSRMQRKLHEYHLDDAPDLRSCNLFFTSLPGRVRRTETSEAIGFDDPRLANFYGMGQPPRVRYVRERKTPNYGRAPEETYRIEWLEEGQ